MAILTANNATATLAANITAAATSVVLTTGHGARFPAVVSPDYLLLTLTEGANIEVVRVTAHTAASDTFTVVRAAEGIAGNAAAAFAFTTAAAVSHRPTAGSLYTPSWYAQQGAGAVFGAYGDGDPAWYASMMDNGAVSGPTPTQITTSIARTVLFRLPRSLTMSGFSVFGVGASANFYKFAIHRRSTGALLWESGTITLANGVWLTQTGTPANPVVLRDVDYWFSVTAAAASTVAALRSPAPPLAGGQYGADAGHPFVGKGLGVPVYAQYAVTSGAFPATLPALAAASYAAGTNGTVPFAWLNGTAS